jgi:hypothetical protein
MPKFRMNLVSHRCFFLLRAMSRFAISPLALLVTVCVVAGPTPGMASPQAPLPPGAKAVETNRFRSPLSYRATLSWYEKHHGRTGHRLTFETLVDLPDVVASHATQKDAKFPYRGLNVSEFEGSVWIFIMAR